MTQNQAVDLASEHYESQKQHLRALARENRKLYTPQQRQELAQQWQNTALEFLAEAKTVAAFVSTEFEPPTYELCKVIADNKKRLLLPKLGPRLTRAWGFFQGLDDLEQLAPGRPPEPSGPAFDNDILLEVDAMIIPALLVSRFGERLGQGGGWYDRALKVVRPNLPVAAMVFPQELIDEHLPQDVHDVKIPYVLLPTEIVTTAV